MGEIMRAIKPNTRHVSEKFNITELIDAYSEQVWRFCRSLAYSKEDAEDLFQETFLKAFEQINKLNAAENPKSFLFSIAVYILKSKKRKFARRNRIAPTEHLDFEIASGINTEDGILQEEENKIVRELVNKLPEKFRIPIMLHYTMELSLPDIATALKLPLGTVKSRLHKARAIIKKELEEIGYGK
jgi:RNA polymerase sigma-70 factor (ECF subfamily)